MVDLCSLESPEENGQQTLGLNKGGGGIYKAEFPDFAASEWVKESGI